MIGLWLGACELPSLREIELRLFAAETAQDPNLPPLAWIDATWVIALGDERALGPYAARRGWVSLVMKRDYADATKDLGPEGKVAAARAHAEMAYLYRQAALVAAYAWVGAYGQGSDRVAGAAHLLTVSDVILGRLDAARSEAGKLEAGEEVRRWHRPWREWLASGASWPPDLGDLPLELPPPAVGVLPEVTELPHYTLVEPDGTWRDVADPGALVALALWHDRAAAAADGEAARAMKVVRASERLPVEPTPVLEGEIPLALLIGSDSLLPADAGFVAAISGSAPPGPIITSWSGKSIVAWLASRALSGEKLDSAKLIERVDALREVLRQRATVAAGGVALAHHETFAELGALGVLRSLVVVAQRLGDDAGASRLRLAVEERSVREGADPVGLLALAAADASLRSAAPARAVVEAEVGRYPSLAAVLYALDALAERAR